MTRASITASVLTASVLSAAMLTAAEAQTVGTATRDLNVRSGPDPQFPVIGMLRNNRRAIVYGCVEGSRWCLIDFRGQRGWAYSQYMVLTGDTVAILPVPEIEVPVATTTVAAAPRPLVQAPIAPLTVPIPVPVPVPVTAWQQPAVAPAPSPVYAATTPPVYSAPAPVTTYQTPTYQTPIATYPAPTYQPPVATYQAPTYQAPAATYQAPPPAVTYRAPAATVVGTTGVAPRRFAGRLIAPREVIYAATTPPRAYMPPRAVRDFITVNPLETVWLEGSLLIGAGIPEGIALVPVPGSRFQYAYVNDYPVLVDPLSRRVVYIYS